MKPASREGRDFKPQNDISEAVTPPNGGVWLQVNLLTIRSQRGLITEINQPVCSCEIS